MFFLRPFSFNKILFHPLDADLSAITQHMVDLELVRTLPSTSTGAGMKVGKYLATTVEDRSGRRSIGGGDQSATSGNITPSSPGSEADIHTNEATRGGSTFEMVRKWEIF